MATRSDLRTMVQRRIGDTSSTTFYTTAFYNDIIDSRVLNRAVDITRWAPSYYLNHLTVDGVDDATDSTNEFYSVGSNFRTFVQLERRFGTGNSAIYEKVPLVAAEDQDKFQYSANKLALAQPDSLTYGEHTVSLWDTRIRIIPAPRNNSYIFRLKYLRQPTTLSSDETVVDVPDEWIEIIVLDCVIYVMHQTGDPLANNWEKLRDQELGMVSREYRRRVMWADGYM